jgi:hypothetical protein
MLLVGVFVVLEKEAQVIWVKKINNKKIEIMPYGKMKPANKTTKKTTKPKPTKKKK